MMWLVCNTVKKTKFNKRKYTDYNREYRTNIDKRCGRYLLLLLLFEINVKKFKTYTRIIININLLYLLIY